MKCAICRRRVPTDAEHCPYCGARAGAMAQTTGGALIEQRPRNAPLAGALSFLLPGIGQLYVGQTGKGLLFLALLLFGPVTGFLSHLVLVLYAAAEAFVLARRLTRGEPVTAWGTLWDPEWRPLGR